MTIWDGTGPKTRWREPWNSTCSTCGGKDSWNSLRVFLRRFSGASKVRHSAVSATCWRNNEPSLSQYGSNTQRPTRQPTTIRRPATIGFRSYPLPATTAAFDSGSSALAGRMGSPACAVAGSCTSRPGNRFLRVECATNSVTKAGKNQAVFSMN